MKRNQPSPLKEWCVNSTLSKALNQAAALHPEEVDLVITSTKNIKNACITIGNKNFHIILAYAMLVHYEQWQLLEGIRVILKSNDFGLKMVKKDTEKDIL